MDSTPSPLADFASDLRRLREQAGSPKYLQMSRRTGRSRTALAEAAGGDHLPNWDTVRAYVEACGGEPARWLVRWEQLRDLNRAERTGGSATSPTVTEVPLLPHSPPAAGECPAPAGALPPPCIGQSASQQPGAPGAAPPDGDATRESDVSIVLHLWREQRAQARQCENHRAITSAIVVLICAASATGSVVDPTAALRDLFSGVVIAFGVFGAATCHKYYERHQMHMTEAQALRRQLSLLRPTLGIESGWRGAREEHSARYPLLYRLRLHQLWVAIHLAVSVVGVVLLAINSG
ncbi:hypothetical protein [Streptacidiphilus sp. P02-A3a]|uniref:hypothetical protein n=1 Tax=Streptacidiphilus sp. P02-A3a TaxID=2704468 RepID=UPI0015FE7A6D|nr:hypothetical protein [Streptacidiphilus sp. P02-A3a]QMU69975.1 helix-turn-helix domain-containing protein [Streptacidiphilus sp. P02-A3a]